MAVAYVRYTTATGVITNHGTSISTEVAESKVKAHQSVYYPMPSEGKVTGETHWMNAGVLAERVPVVASWDKVAITADEVDEAVLATLPNPCTVYVDGDPVVVTDGTFEFSAIDPGVYKISIEEPGYLSTEWLITAEVV